MRFADPQACPVCHSRLDGSTRCPNCGMDLASPEVVELWQTLQHADELVERALAAREAVGAAPRYPPPPSTPAPPTSTTSPPPRGMPPPNVEVPPVGPLSDGSFPAYPAPPSPVSTGPSWSVGTVLLSLGAFGLVVAAVIFVSRSWDTIGLAGKAAIMLAATVLAGAVAAWATCRPLRASAEALWAVFLVLVWTDLFAARAEGLAGLDAVSWSWTWIGAGLVIAAASAAVLVWSRGPIGSELSIPAIGTVVGLVTTAVGASATFDGEAFWRTFVGLLVAGALGLALRLTGSRRVAIGARIVVGGFYVVAAIQAFIELRDHPSFRELAVEAHGLPLLLVSAAAVGIAVAISSARVAMTALAFAGLFVLITVPSSDAWTPEGGFLALAATASVPVVATLRGSGPWLNGIRIGSLLPICGLAFVAAWWVGGFWLDVTRGFDDPWTKGAGDRLVGSDVSDTTVWPTVVVAAALLLIAYVVPRWPSVRGPLVLRETALVVAVLLAVMGIVAVTRPPWWAAAAAPLVVAVAAAGWARLRPASWVIPAGAVVAVGLAVAMSVGAESASVGVWITGGLVLLVIATLPRPPISLLAAAVAPALLAAGAAAAADLAGAGRFGSAVTALVVALLLVGASVLLPRLPDSRVAVEAGGAAAAVVALVSAGDGGRAALAWTVTGVVACAVAATRPDRRWYVLPGLFCLLAAYLLLIVDSGFSFVEAYTLPLGVVMLGAGLWWMLRRPRSQDGAVGSWAALGVGLSVCLLPSVPQALADPTGLRALLLGIAALVALAFGARLDWQAPFVLGSAVALAIVLFNIGPYANAAPRVLLIAIVSVALVAVGVTWEDRVRDGRRIMAFVKAMR